MSTHILAGFRWRRVILFVKFHDLVLRIRCLKIWSPLPSASLTLFFNTFECEWNNPFLIQPSRCSRDLGLYRFEFAKLHNLAYRNTAATLVQPGEGSLYWALRTQSCCQVLSTPSPTALLDQKQQCFKINYRTFYSATSFLEKCKKVVLEKWFFKLGFFFLVNHFSPTWKNVDL